MDGEYGGDVPFSDLVGEKRMEEGDITDCWHDPVHSVQQWEDEAEVTEGHRPASQTQHRHVAMQPLSVPPGILCPGVSLHVHLLRLITTSRY